MDNGGLIILKSESVMAGIISYNPDIIRLEENIESIYSQVSKVVILDNGSRNILDIESICEKYENILLIKNEKNNGIAFALNQIGDYAFCEGYSYFLTLDQDSISDDGLINELQRMFSDDTVGIACPYINRHNDYIKRSNITEVNSCITSGSLMNTKIWCEIGGFWDYLFIDEVDHEYCYHMRNQGYRILQTNNVSINHIIGSPKTIRKYGHVFHPTNHSPFRRYYISRNCILMKLLYPHESEPFKKRYRMLFRIFVSTMLCEDQKLMKVKAMIKGILDAFLWYRKHKQIKQRRISMNTYAEGQKK